MLKGLNILVMSTFFLIGQDAHAKPVKVITVTEDGNPVKARIKIRTYPAGDADAFVMDEGRGYTTVWIENCSNMVSVTATAELIGIVRKIDGDLPDWLPCKEPEIVFNDFLIQTFAFSTDNPSFADEDFWRNTLGEATIASAPNLATDISASFQNKEYGKISIIATEMQYRLREAGRTQEADFLYSLAVGASAKEILELSDQPSEKALVYSPETNRFELSGEAQAIISDYQQRVLSVPFGSPNLGKIDWKTMRALEGGSAVSIPDIRIGIAEVDSFSINKDLLAVQPQFD